jgi:hypothetical protein
LARKELRQMPQSLTRFNWNLMLRFALKQLPFAICIRAELKLELNKKSKRSTDNINSFENIEFSYMFSPKSFEEINQAKILLGHKPFKLHVR